MKCLQRSIDKLKIVSMKIIKFITFDKIQTIRKTLKIEKENVVFVFYPNFSLLDIANEFPWQWTCLVCLKITNICIQIQFSNILEPQTKCTLSLEWRTARSATPGTSGRPGGTSRTPCWWTGSTATRISTSRKLLSGRLVAWSSTNFKSRDCSGHLTS